MLPGQEAKARRGELFKGLPIGYARDPMGKIIFHPNRRVYEAIQLVFVGCQFTSAAFTDALTAAGVRISMDGRGRWMENVFVERLWRSLKQKDVYLKGYADGREGHSGIAQWLGFYNNTHPHQALGSRTPMAVCLKWLWI